MKFLASVFLMLFILNPTGFFAANNPNLDSLLIEIDNAIKNQNSYIGQKENYIQKIKSQLGYSGQTPESRYIIYTQLVNEYKAFQSDSLKKYSTERLLTAETINNYSWIVDSKINLALVEAQKGLFQEAIDILDNMDRHLLTRQQLIDYYKAGSDTYIYWLEYLDGLDNSSLIEKRQAAQDSLIEILPIDSYDYAVHFGTKYIERGEFDKAEIVLQSIFSKLTPDNRDYAVLTSLLAYLHERKGDIEKQKEFLALSALSDIRGAILENTSLRTLALLLFNENEIQRANRYIKKSMEDANFYNARLRNLQTARILPIIDNAYQQDRIRQQKKLTNLLITISILSFILLVTIFFVIRQMRKLARAQKKILEINARLNELNMELKNANEQQHLTNKSLAEANHIKENFISNFLEICTEYIGKLEKFKQSVHIKLKVGQTNDILRMTSSTADSTKELKELYENFDKAFLNIYPDFVEEFNKLLRPEERYTIYDNNTLNQELRIFALIRLGINDSNKMAVFLHYSLRTIYNYRSKVKSKALNQKEDFEEKVRQLCS
ncbi:DUF6377 domain-containing protein [Proteiniphilum acetatigenes]|uniref:DUF6377 domain-containing protein n=1 Tax=Proteiniphilum acetatigenes TaxID=294710 RepID=UPI000368D1D2|nr:DUF6377 domain-containing protein [Proteiniphilum acetatigenes]